MYDQLPLYWDLAFIINIRPQMFQIVYWKLNSYSYKMHLPVGLSATTALFVKICRKGITVYGQSMNEIQPPYLISLNKKIELLFMPCLHARDSMTLSSWGELISVYIAEMT